MNMVSLENVTKTYRLAKQRFNAIENISLQVDASEFLMITGPSGAGKTTLLNLMGGMTRCDSGNIVIKGNNICLMNNTKLARFRSQSIGFIFQFQSMISTLNVIENIMLPFGFSKIKPDKTIIKNVIHTLGLGGREQAYEHQLSIGQQRRVAVAREMVREPELLLCDEPTGDLDPDSERLVMKLIAERHKKGTAIIMVTHNHALKEYATKRLTLSNGSICGVH